MPRKNWANSTTWKLPGRFPSLEGGGDTARYMQFHDAADLKAKKAELAKVVKAWCAMKDAE